MSLISFINWVKKNPFKKKKVESNSVQKDKEAFAKIILDRKSKITEKKSKIQIPTISTYIIGGITFNVGDKVICRSNEPHPLWFGEIVEFWNNNGKWLSAVPIVKNSRTGKIWTVMGVIKPYSEELMTILTPMKPLEQWNSLVPTEMKYTKEHMLRKELDFKKKQKFLLTKKVKGSLPKKK